LFFLVADALSINLGTLTSEQRRAIELAVNAANKRDLPWVLDPVGVGLRWTRDFAFELLEKKPPTAIRGNASEIVTLGGGEGNGRGVNSTMTSLDALVHANELR
jgi:hydroxyethylthiazole kinase